MHILKPVVIYSVSYSVRQDTPGTPAWLEGEEGHKCIKGLPSFQV